MVSLGFAIDYTRIAYALGAVAASYVLAYVINYIIERYISRLAAKTKSDLDVKLIHLIRKPVYYIILLVGVYVAVGFILITPASKPLTGVVSVAGIIVLGWFAGRLSDLIISEFGGRIAQRTGTTIDNEALPFISKFVKTIIYVITLSMVLEKLGYSIGPIITSLGLAGFAVGFAAKDTISNILAGFFILVDRPFKIGDRIEIGSTIGDVVEIGLRTTKLKTTDNEIVIVPNSSIVSLNVTNYSLPNDNQKMKLSFGISYDSDVEKAKRILAEVANKTELILKNPKPVVYFMEFGESSINLALVVWTEDLRQKDSITDKINSEVWKRFKAEEIDVPFPVRTVYLRKEK